jgi:hypothetical protein
VLLAVEHEGGDTRKRGTTMQALEKFFTNERSCRCGIPQLPDFGGAFWYYDSANGGHC